MIKSDQAPLEWSNQTKHLSSYQIRQSASRVIKMPDTLWTLSTYKEVRKYTIHCNGNMIWKFHQIRQSASRVIKMSDTLCTLSTYREERKTIMSNHISMNMIVCISLLPYRYLGSRVCRPSWSLEMRFVWFNHSRGVLSDLMKVSNHISMKMNIVFPHLPIGT